MKAWIKAAGIRALKTAAQSALAVMTISLVGDAVGVIQGIDWWMFGGAAAFSALYSFLTSIAGLPEVNEGESPIKGKE